MADRSAILPDLPPWFWIWVPLFLWQVTLLPSTYAGQIGAMLAAAGGPVSEVRLLTRAFTAALVAQAAAYAVLAVGVGLSFLPWLRARLVERRFGLETAPEGYPSAAWQEVLAELARVAPGLEVRANLADRRYLAFVYPAGLRRRRIAIFGGLLALWRRDPDAGRAVLVHETAHLGTGDALFVGTGAPLERVVRHWPIIAAGGALVPLLWAGVEIIAAALDDRLYLLGGGSDVAGHVLSGAALVGVNLSLWYAAIFVVPVAAIWSIELAADRATLARGADRAGYRRVLAQGGHRGVSSRLLAALSHPPPSLRAWALRHRRAVWWHALLLLLFPLAYLVRLLLLLPWAATQAWAEGRAGVGIVAMLRTGAADYLAAVARPMLVMALLAASWPVLRWAAAGRGLDRSELRVGSSLSAAFCLLLPTLVPALLPERPALQAALEVRPVHGRDEVIEARFSGLTGSPYDWITLVAQNAPLDEWGEWAWLDGAAAGVRQWPPPEPGRYEVRLFQHQEDGSDRLVARARVEVRP
ncbi:MAG TPA: M48 family metalloprotease [Geminicoccaceae bacterium]|nr:M48 family metalloprotease [Geminicoccaceae bacterium]